MKYLILMILFLMASPVQATGLAGPKASSGSGEKKGNVSVPYKPSGGESSAPKSPVKKKPAAPKPAPVEKPAPKAPLPFIPSKGFEPVGAPDLGL